MADTIDYAEAAYSKILEASISKSRLHRKLPDIGHCYNCQEPLNSGSLFCDADCRDDYEKREMINRRA